MEIRKLKRLFDIVERGKYMWESTFDAIRDPVMIIDGNYRVLRANLAAAGRSGHAIRDLVGQRCYERFAGRKSICPHCPLEHTLKTGVSRMVSIDRLRRDGDFTVNSYPLKPKGARAPLAVHHYHDVTDEKRLQRQLIQSEKMAAIGMLAGGVAHEINNPLAGILAFTQLMRNELPAEGDLRNDLNEIEEAAKRCKKIVEDLLTFARPHNEGDLVPLFLDETVEKILPLARLNLRHRNVTLVTAYDADLPPVRGNAARLQQVFLNLITNAAQAMSASGREGGEVAVSLRRDPEGGRIFAEVKDQGAGITKQNLSKIFDPFFSTKDRSEGTGLGLSVCHSIVSEHGGTIEVETEEGRGSVFRVIFPAQTGNPPKADGSSLQSGEILLSPETPSRSSKV